MRFQFLIVLMITIAAAGTYWYTSTASICPAPLSYRLGTLDSEFNISPEVAKEHMLEAESLWEAEAGRDLFVYDEGAQFVVDFVFDERQEFADGEATESHTLDAQRQKNDEVMATVQSLQSDYEELKQSYESKVATYETRLKKYNQTVSNYNDRGGAPSDEYEALQQEQRALDGEVEKLSVLSDELNDLAERINELGQRGNEMVEAYNREVASYNEQYGFSREFTQGDYQGDKINIYKFSSDRELVAVLTHEFGHALGIGHVEGEASIMYYLLVDTSQPLALSVEDRQVLIETCGDGTSLSETVRRYIRTALANFNI